MHRIKTAVQLTMTMGSLALAACVSPVDSSVEPVDQVGAPWRLSDPRPTLLDLSEARCDATSSAASCKAALDEASELMMGEASGALFSSAALAQLPHRVRPTVLGRWMFPYHTNHDQLVAERIPELVDDVDFPRTSFQSQAMARFFKNQLAIYVTEIIVACEYGDELQQLLQNKGAHGYIDSFGELTSDLPPNENLADAAGWGGEYNIEVITTLPVSNIVNGVGVDSGVHAPLFLVPLYERYLVQHEFGHMLHYNLWQQNVDGRSLDQAIHDSYGEALRHEALFFSCYGASNYKEFWAEATAAYFSPIPIAAVRSGPGNSGWSPDGDDSQCTGLTPEAKQLMREQALPVLTGAELIEQMQPSLYQLLNAVYGAPLEFSLRR